MLRQKNEHLLKENTELTNRNNNLHRNYKNSLEGMNSCIKDYIELENHLNFTSQKNDHQINGNADLNKITKNISDKEKEIKLEKSNLERIATDLKQGKSDHAQNTSDITTVNINQNRKVGKFSKANISAKQKLASPEKTTKNKLIPITTING